MSENITSYINRIEIALEKIIAGIENRQSLHNERINQLETILSEETKHREFIERESQENSEVEKIKITEEFDNKIQEYIKREQVLLNEIKSLKKQLSIQSKQRIRDVEEIKLIIREFEEILSGS